MKKKTWMKCIASCLTFVLLVTMVPVQAAANTEKEGGTGTPGTASGGAASIATPTPTATASATPTATASATPAATATVNPTLYELDAPTVTARGGSNRVMLSWNKVTGASGYYIYSRKSSESVYQQTAVVKGADTVSYLIKSLPQNTTYYYRVAAYCEVSGTQIEGKLSTAVSAKTAAVSATSKGAKKYSTKAAFTKSPAYKTYKKMRSAMNYNKSFAIPGMKTTNVAGFSCTTMVPQGLCLAGSYFLITAYDYKK